MEHKFHYRIHKSSTLVPILCHINPMHILCSYLSNMHFNIISLLHTSLPNDLLSSGFPTTALYALSSPHARQYFKIYYPKNLLILLEPAVNMDSISLPMFILLIFLIRMLKYMWYTVIAFKKVWYSFFNYLGSFGDRSAETGMYTFIRTDKHTHTWKWLKPVFQYQIK